MTDFETSFSEMTIYDLINFVDKQATKINLEHSITSFFALFLKVPTDDLGVAMKGWIDWYIDAVKTLNKTKILEIDEKMLNFIKSPAFQSILNETEPIRSLQDEIAQINQIDASKKKEVSDKQSDIDDLQDILKEEEQKAKEDQQQNK